MAESPGRARLAAILAADVVGYSRLVEQDEAGTLAAIKGLREQVIDPLLAEHQGRIVKLMGDGAIVEFALAWSTRSPAPSRCRRRVAERQARSPPSAGIVFRIGVNLGDVVVEGDDLLGDGVNVAARLEQLCEPGGVLVSGTAYDHLQGRLGLPLEFTGEQQVKNIARPVRAYRVRLDGAAARRPASGACGRRPRRPAAALLGLLALAAGGAWWLWPGEAAAGKPSVAVLPFANLARRPRGGEVRRRDHRGPDHRPRPLPRPARDRPQLHRGLQGQGGRRAPRSGRSWASATCSRAASSERGGRVRVTAQLVDAATGGHLWAERYDRPEATCSRSRTRSRRTSRARSAAGTAGSTRRGARRQGASRRRAWRPTTSTCSAWSGSTGTQGRPCSEAIRLLSRAVELDPGFARGWTMLGVAYGMAAASGFVDDPSPPTGCGSRTSRKLRTLDPFDAFTQARLGGVRALEGDLKGAEAASTRRWRWPRTTPTRCWS